MPAPYSEGSAPEPVIPGPVGGYRNAPVGAPGFDSSAPEIIDGPPELNGAVYVDVVALNKAFVFASMVADRAEGAARLVEGAVQRSGPAPWGDDPGLGQSFGLVFAEPRQALVSTIGKLAVVLQEVAEKLEQTKQVFADAEAEANVTARWRRGQD